MNKILAALCASAVLGFSYLYFSPSAGSPERAANTHPIAASDSAAPSGASVAPPSSSPSNAMSPFGLGNPPRQEDASVRIGRLQKKMEKMGFFTPEKYYKFNLKTLKTMADAGDMFAALQLSEQYHSENSALESDPDYDFSASPTVESNKYLAKAAAMGVVRAGTLLSLRYHDEERPLDAHAWKIVSEKFGDKFENLHIEQKVSFPTDAGSVKQAQNKADEIINAILSGPRPVFPQ